MKILALITARGGSKRLPGKNIRLLGDKPLLAWSIQVVHGVPEICDVLVSTDDENIKSIAEKYNGYVPWLRPNELATDIASSVDVAIHAIDWYEKNKGEIDAVLLLQPTSPFRTRETIIKGIELFSKSQHHTILGVSPTHAHPKWTFKIDSGKLTPYLKEHGLNIRSQDLEPAYVVNGSFYLIACEDLRKEKSFIGKNTIPLIIDSDIESLDIDTESDWQYAEYC
ncbi:MAG TPA: acylneuraminate cytidylyltransferase family protein, partial [Thioploca sp.]|nr:acylneuraminate cytidylyltransferase family protein [Thioploca sp.]